jgi:hypothetical protein
MNKELQNTDSLLRKYFCSMNQIIPYYYFLFAIALAVPALFFGKSLRYFIALSALFFLPLLLRIAFKNAAEKKWLFLLCSTILLCLLTLISGTLLGIAARLIFQIFILFLVLWIYSLLIFPSEKMYWLVSLLIATYLTYELYKFITVETQSLN